MRRRISFLIIFICLISFVGCSTNKKNQISSKVQFDMKKGKQLVQLYFTSLMKNEGDEKKYYSSELKKKVKETKKSSEMQLKGFKVTQTNQVLESGIFKVRVAYTGVSKPAAILDEYTLKVIIDENSYKIDNINSDTVEEAYMGENGLRIREKSSVKTSLITDTDGIPEYTFSKKDKANLEKIKVPKDNLQNTIFSYTGDSIALTTGSKDAFIGLISIDQSRAVQGKAQGQGGGGSQGGGQDGGSQGGESDNQSTPKEIPIGKQVNALDIIKNAKVSNLMFTPDEKFVLVEYNKSDTNMKSINIYSAEKGDIIPFNFDENFNTNDVQVVFSSFDENYVYFQVIPKEDKKDAQKQNIGLWKLDLKTFKASKI